MSANRVSKRTPTRHKTVKPAAVREPPIAAYSAEAELPAGQFKAKCLAIMDTISEKGTTLTITKHGVPVVRIVPATNAPTPLFGRMRGTVTVLGDIIAPIDMEWNALADD